MNLVEKIKQHWKVILICLLAMMWMSKCTTGCSQERTINSLKTELHQKDSVITVLNDKCDSLETANVILNVKYDSEKSHNADISNISKMSIDELRVKVQTLTDEIKKLTGEIKKRTDENNRLKNLVNGLTKENSILRSQLDTTIRK